MQRHVVLSGGRYPVLRSLAILYVLGAARENDTISFPVEGVDGGSISMLTISFA